MSEEENKQNIEEQALIAEETPDAEASKQLSADVSADTGADAGADGTAAAPSPKKGFWGKVDDWFGITKSGSNFKTETVAGITTFMAMVYILMVNAGMFENVIGGADPYGAAYIATSVGAIVGTFLMAFLARMPLAQASGMGINAFIVFTLLNKTGLTYANSMVFVLIDGVIFLILTVTGLRRKIFEAIPAGVRHAIPVGIGLFIAFIGLQQAGVIVDESSTLTTFVSFNLLNDPSFVTYANGTVGGILPAIVALIGVVIIAVLSKKNVKGAILWGLLGSAILYYVFAGIAVGAGSQGAIDMFRDISLSNPIDAFKAWGTDSVGVVFYEGFNFDQYLSTGTNSTCTGAIAGTSTVTTFVESSSGVVAGGRTGFTSFVTGMCFVLAMFLSPIAQLIPRSATATALIWVGVLMMSSVTKVDWSDAAEAIVAFMTFITMLLGYSISKGIGMGIITYIVIQVCTGNIKKITIPTWVIGAIFLATFLLT